MRILFIPNANGGLSHQIPLYVLSQRILHLKPEFAFLLPLRDHEHFRKNNVPVIRMDYKGTLNDELAAYKYFQPDMVVDDLCPNTIFAKALHPVFRIAIQRTGIFIPEINIKPGYRHSGNPATEFPDVSTLGLKNVSDFADFFISDVKIVPGIRSVEVLPGSLQNDPGYYFSGPLNMEDYLSADLKQRLESFLQSNEERIKVYFTFGLVAMASDAILNCIKFLLDNEVAVITNIRLDNLEDALEQRYFFNYFLPLNFICAHADLVIHHCGSGMYHYPILNEKPSMTIGTMCYDRENVALQLQRLGVSRHLPSPLECDDFEIQFRAMFLSFINDPKKFSDKKNLRNLKDEIHQTMLDFSFGDVLEQAVSFSTQIK
jgi:UDP:flavonoid glycosyltransferase YjiC (YdhE family)